MSARYPTNYAVAPKLTPPPHPCVPCPVAVPSFVYATTTQVVTLPWTFKFFFGMLNDCVPLWGGYRRKPYMVMGWAMCTLVLCVMSFNKLPDPYWCVDALSGEFITIETYPNGTAKHDADGSPVPAEPCNAAARDAGGAFALWMSLAALGYVVADVAADGLTVEYARREPLAKRGTTQSTVYLVRTIGSFTSFILVGFCMNGKEYNGSFDWSLSFPQICLCFALPCALMIPASWYLVVEKPVPQGRRGGGVRPGLSSTLRPESLARGGRSLQGSLVSAAPAAGGGGGGEGEGGGSEAGKDLEEEELDEPVRTFAEYRSQCWTLLQSKAMFYCVIYQVSCFCTCLRSALSLSLSLSQLHAPRPANMYALLLRRPLSTSSSTRPSEPSPPPRAATCRSTGRG